MNNKLTNGGKPSWLTYLIGIGLIVSLLLNFTKVFDRIGSKSVIPALLAQEVKEIDARLETTESDMKLNNSKDNKQHTDIEILKKDVANVVKIVEAQTVAQNKTNDLLFEIVAKLPNE